MTHHSRLLMKALLSALLYLFLVVGLLLAGGMVWLYATRIPDADIQLNTVSRDTTFFIGTGQSGKKSPVVLSMRATGYLDGPTAALLVNYPAHPVTALRGQLPKGNVDCVWSGDFYDSRARLIFRHNTVKRGHLRLRVVFSYPPDDWGFRFVQTGWVKVR